MCIRMHTLPYSKVSILLMSKCAHAQCMLRHRKWKVTESQFFKDKWVDLRGHSKSTQVIIGQSIPFMRYRAVYKCIKTFIPSQMIQKARSNWTFMFVEISCDIAVDTSNNTLIILPLPRGLSFLPLLFFLTIANFASFVE